MRNHLSKLHYLLLVAFLLAMTGCGAHNLAGLGGNGTGTPGAVNAKLVWGQTKAKTTAKSVKLAAPSAVKSVAVMVTGTGIDGNPIPVATGSVDTATNQGQVAGIYPGKVTLSIKAYDQANATGNVLYEGFAIGVNVNAGATTTLADPIVMTVPVEKAQDKVCVQCHETALDFGNGQNLVADFKQTGHYTNQAFNSFSKYSTVGVVGTGCAGCHGPSHNDRNPATSGRCYECHTPTVTDSNHVAFLGGKTYGCSKCHASHDVSGASEGCIGCHSVVQNSGEAFVQDNNGVRAVTAEFSKWSHHVTGVTLNNLHCAACHLEGRVGADGKAVVNPSFHMVDAKVHLRNAHDDSDMQWDPATPNHTTMDNFCMSCHSATGATSPVSVAIQAAINAGGVAAVGKTASPLNPFGDTISNRYDKMQRPAVTNVNSQFDTTNNSHHGVKGPRYTGRTRAAGSRQIANAGAFATNSTAALQGIRSTMYDAGNFNNLYVPLGNAAGETAPRTGSASLGDDSTLHCGDCHTVGQWKPGSSTNADGSQTTVAIGAHGSNNEYLLRNSIGTDQRHVGVSYTVSTANVVTATNAGAPYLVCFNCHSYNKYGSVFIGTGVDSGVNGTEMGNVQPHAGEYAQAGRCNGPGNTLPFNGFTTGAGTDGFASRFMNKVTTADAATGYQSPEYGNVFGIQCLNCHNSGAANAYGGIHGSANDTSWNGVTPTALLTAASVTKTGNGWYIDGMGNANKVERFLPGLGNAMHVPGTLGGFNGGTTVYSNTSSATSTSVTRTGSTVYGYNTGGVASDTNWEQKHWQQKANTVINYNQTAVQAGQGVLNTQSVGAGCYTLGTSTNINANVTVGVEGPSVTGQGGAATELVDTWGGCDDHTAAQGKGNHGFLKRIVRPITY